MWCHDNLHIAVCDHPLNNVVSIYSCHGVECYRAEGDRSVLGPVILRQAHSLPLLLAAGYEASWRLIDTRQMKSIETISFMNSDTITSVRSD